MHTLLRNADQRLRQAALAMALLLPWLAGCTTAPPQAPAPRLDAPLLLLGEVHDNAAGQALRLQALQRLLAQGKRPALLMEQFDRERQADIDRIVQAAPGMPPGDAEFDATVDALVKLGSPPGAGWSWPLLRPVLRLALQHRLPIVAANVSRAEARRIIQLGLAPTGYQADVPADIARAQADAIEASHCGAVDADMATRLADAQVARDQLMARQIKTFADRGVVLLAGNGHVRRDIGVPRWLAPDLRSRSHAVGYLEAGDDSAEAYDEVITMTPHPRPDTCAAMRPPVPPLASPRSP